MKLNIYEATNIHIAGNKVTLLRVMYEVGFYNSIDTSNLNVSIDYYKDKFERWTVKLKNTDFCRSYVVEKKDRLIFKAHIKIIYGEDCIFKKEANLYVLKGGE